MINLICKELGVAPDEYWKGDDGYEYCIYYDGDLERFDGDEYHIVNHMWNQILSGSIKPIWQPDYNEEYYTPAISIDENDRYQSWLNSNHLIDHWNIQNGLAFRTKAEAIKATNKMLRVIRG